MNYAPNPIPKNFAVNKPKIKIFLVDDHPLVREWLTNLIHQQPDLVVCGESEDAPHALQEISTAKPDVAIVDISLKHGSGIELIKNLKAQHPGIAIIVLSMHDERLYAERALRAGARGYIMKRETAKKSDCGDSSGAGRENLHERKSGGGFRGKICGWPAAGQRFAGGTIE